MPFFNSLLTEDDSFRSVNGIVTNGKIITVVHHITMHVTISCTMYTIVILGLVKISTPSDHCTIVIKTKPINTIIVYNSAIQPMPLAKF